jgi:predicted metal-dependent hydrolase
MDSMTSFTLDSGEIIPITITNRAGLRNITLRPKLTPTHELRVSAPRRVSNSTIAKFIAEKSRWINRAFSRAPQKIKIVDGTVIPILGHDVTIKHDPAGRAGCFMSDAATLTVCGGADMIERRVRDEIKKLFLNAAKRECAGLPPAFRPRKITVRDTSSRWGSCSADRNVSLCWRLAFAPRSVMRYVIMHELAHLKHMDHSPAFWRQCSELYGPGVERAKLWLNKNAADLHKYF